MRYANTFLEPPSLARVAPRRVATGATEAAGCYRPACFCIFLSTRFTASLKSAGQVVLQEEKIGWLGGGIMSTRTTMIAASPPAK